MPEEGLINPKYCLSYQKIGEDNTDFIFHNFIKNKYTVPPLQYMQDWFLYLVAFTFTSHMSLDIDII